MELYLCWLANYEGEDAEANHLESSIAVPALDRSNFWSLTLPAYILRNTYGSSPLGCSGMQVAGRHQCCSPSIRAQACNRYVLTTCALLVDLLIDLGDLGDRYLRWT
jgi:hypothetical protein